MTFYATYGLIKKTHNNIQKAEEEDWYKSTQKQKGKKKEEDSG